MSDTLIPKACLFAKLLSIFALIDDPRVQGRTKYPLPAILTICLLGTFAGCNGWLDIVDYVTSNFKLFQPYLGLAAVPGVDAVARAVAKLNASQLCDGFLSITKELLKIQQNRKPGRPSSKETPYVIALDGKSITGSLPRGKGKTDVHIVNAVVCYLTLAFKRILRKSNEITAFPILLASLAKHGLLKRAVVTIDALGCQKDLAKLIIGYNSNWLFGLKGNHGNFHKQIIELFQSWLTKFAGVFRVETYKTKVNITSGRIERRLVKVVYLNRGGDWSSWLTEALAWAGIKSVIMVERRVADRMVKGVFTPGFCEVRYFISSLDLSAQQLADVILNHWSVEIIHNQLDVSYGEDKCKVNRGAAAEVLSGFKKLALNIFNFTNDKCKSLNGKCKSMSVPRLIRLLSRSPEFLLYILTNPIGKVVDPLGWLTRWVRGAKATPAGNPGFAVAV